MNNSSNDIVAYHSLDLHTSLESNPSARHLLFISPRRASCSRSRPYLRIDARLAPGLREPRALLVKFNLRVVVVVDRREREHVRCCCCWKNTLYVHNSLGRRCWDSFEGRSAPMPARIPARRRGTLIYMGRQRGMLFGSLRLDCFVLLLIARERERCGMCVRECMWTLHRCGDSCANAQGNTQYIYFSSTPC